MNCESRGEISQSKKKKLKKSVEKNNDKNDDCNVSTGVQEREKEKGSEKQKNNKNSDNGNGNERYQRKLSVGYEINNECLVMDGMSLNIPRMRHSNPFENITKRQRIISSGGVVVQNGSENYGINELRNHVTDPDSEVSSDSDNDDDIGDGNQSDDNRL